MLIKKIAVIVGMSLLFCTGVSAGEKTVISSVHKAMPCSACHLTDQPTTIPKNETCLTCHGDMKTLIEKTSKYALNPHNSPHWKDSVPCGTCHKQHEKPIVYCEACHKNQNYVAR